MTCRITSVIQENIATINQYRTVGEGVEIMVNRGVGSLVVMEGSSVVGYFTERDLMVRVVGKRRDPARTPIHEVMTRDLVRVEYNATCKYSLNLMREYRIRHLVVFDGPRFLGVVSMRDIAAQVTRSVNYSDIMVNVVGGVVLLVVLSVIGILIYLVPDMMGFVKRFFA
ncbi:MAG: CBS domain-containing protein [Magnetococcales bacterium]|nr:CBS domain-containing protein [Magnetococcales bacterium]MBF0439454.1 CBS domain-containing protein [Magnetococcales bacterium]